MAVNLVPIPSGIDYPIGEFQQLLYERLYPMWGLSGLTSDDFQVYGRCYRNSDKDGFTPQLYTQGVDYNQDMFYTDKLSAMIWFGINDPTGVEFNRHLYDVSMYVMLNLNDVKPNNPTQRMDEKVIQDVMKLVATGWYGFIPTKVVRDIDNVLQRFSGTKKKAAIINTNHSEKLCFRVDFKNAIDINDYDCDRAIPQPYYFNAMTGAIRAVIKDTPDTSLMQTLVNGVQIPLEYPSGTTLTIPHVSGRFVFPEMRLGKNTMDEGIDYTLIGDVFDFAPNTTLYENDLIIFNYNENQ